MGRNREFSYFFGGPISRSGNRRAPQTQSPRGFRLNFAPASRKINRERYSGRVEATRLLGLPTVPTLRHSHLSPEERRAYVLADNKLALNAGWDQDILAIELQALIDLEFDVTLTGFSLAEIDFKALTGTQLVYVSWRVNIYAA